MDTSTLEKKARPGPQDWAGSDQYPGGIVRRVELVPLRLPFKTEFKIAAGGPRPGIDVMVVRLHTESGEVGIRETHAWMRQGSRETLKSLESVIADHFAPRIVGRSAFESSAILAQLRETVWNTNYAIAPIADALLDLQGKLLGVPAYQLVGADRKLTRGREASEARAPHGQGLAG